MAARCEWQPPRDDAARRMLRPRSMRSSRWRRPTFPATQARWPQPSRRSAGTHTIGCPGGWSPAVGSIIALCSPTTAFRKTCRGRVRGRRDGGRARAFEMEHRGARSSSSSCPGQGSRLPSGGQAVIRSQADSRRGALGTGAARAGVQGGAGASDDLRIGLLGWADSTPFTPVSPGPPAGSRRRSRRDLLGHVGAGAHRGRHRSPPRGRSATDLNLASLPGRKGRHHLKGSVAQTLARWLSTRDPPTWRSRAVSPRHARAPGALARLRARAEARWRRLKPRRRVRAVPDERLEPRATLPRPLSAGALAVLAPRPAAGPALAFLQFLLGPPDAALSGGRLLGILDPADELVAGQGRDVLPGIECRGVGDQRLTQVRGQLMHHPTGHSRPLTGPW